MNVFILKKRLNTIYSKNITDCKVAHLLIPSNYNVDTKQMITITHDRFDDCVVKINKW